MIHPDILSDHPIGG